MKHIKFEESEVMQSYVDQAVKRGMIKQDGQSELIKKAAAAIASEPVQTDPTQASVQENVLRLCAGLRRKGLNSFATKLENNLINLKIADTHLYRAHDEDGDDLLHQAHPEGSVEMAEAKDELGVVEDKLDAHKKMVQVVNKTPTGKLAANLFSMVKVVLSQDVPNVDHNIDQAKKKLSEGFDAFSKLILWLRSQLPNQNRGLFRQDFYPLMDSYKDEMAQSLEDFGKSPSLQPIIECGLKCDALKREIEENHFITKEAKTKLLSYVDKVKLRFDAAAGALRGDEEQFSSAELMSPLGALGQFIDQNILAQDKKDHLNDAKAKLSDQNKQRFDAFFGAVQGIRNAIQSETAKLPSGPMTLNAFKSGFVGTPLEMAAKGWNNPQDVKTWSEQKTQQLRQVVQSYGIQTS